MSLYDSPGVYIRERDLSQVILSVSATVAALVGVFRKGPVLKPVLITSAKQFRDVFGDPDASISFAGYCAINFFEKGGQQLLVQRVVHTDAQYGGGVVFDTMATESFILSDPEDSEWADNISSESGSPILLVTDVGPSGSSDQKSFRLTSRNVMAPVVTYDPLTTGGGDLGSGFDYSYIVVARNGDLQSTGSAPVTASLGDGVTSAFLKWNWDGVAQSYDIYRLQVESGLPYVLAGTIGLSALDRTANTISFMDDGSQNLAIGDIDPPSLSAITEPQFKIQFFDTSVYANSPTEVYDVTWTDSVDGDGVQTQIEERVNGFSTKFRVKLNPLFDYSELAAFNTDKQGFEAGDSGTAPTASDIANGWDAFNDPEETTARVFINGGYSNPIVQKKMVQVAELRGDAFAILDAPPTAQVKDNVYSFTDYRRLELNENTNRAALYGPDILYADTINGKTLYVPPSGYVAGVFAYTDFTRNPAYQPAGLVRGQLPNALGTRVRYKQAERDILGVSQCNPIMNFPGEGIIPWDGLTLQSERSGFSFISIRRIFDTIEIAIKKFLKPEVHDPNDEFTRRAIKAAIEEYLTFWLGQHAIKSFQVDISDAINQGFVTTLGQLNVHVYIEPIYPVRAIEVAVGLTKAGANFDYLISGNALD